MMAPGFRVKQEASRNLWRIRDFVCDWRERRMSSESLSCVSLHHRDGPLHAKFVCRRIRLQTHERPLELAVSIYASDSSGQPAQLVASSGPYVDHVCGAVLSAPNLPLAASGEHPIAFPALSLASSAQTWRSFCCPQTISSFRRPRDRTNTQLSKCSSTPIQSSRSLRCSEGTRAVVQHIPISGAPCCSRSRFPVR